MLACCSSYIELLTRVLLTYVFCFFPSHNRYIRALQKGYRCLEIDCWDGKQAPIVTHGHTFCTIEQFNEVAKAISECAFVTSELPVILSLEMHCKPAQQRMLANMLVEHLGSALLLVRPLALARSIQSPPVYFRRVAE